MIQLSTDALARTLGSQDRRASLKALALGLAPGLVGFAPADGIRATGIRTFQSLQPGTGSPAQLLGSFP